MKTIESFLNEIHEKSWRQNIRLEAKRKFDEIIENLQNNEEEILDEIIDDVKRAEKIQLEDNTTFNYSLFQMWLDYCSRNIISEKTKEKDDE